MQVYMHHYVGATTMLVEAGAELRGRMTRAPVRLSRAVGIPGFPKNAELQCLSEEGRPSSAINPRHSVLAQSGELT